ncbi:very short patch repair endonuclease [Youhaiella tibetensis]|uniref:Very short patch repair endonuclease n=1 Tax=Paradevosia tibetensis TaxID=1447062 RepID=A0A5B9DLW4_9HYPH|nr:very short patch repair endonuclease [Youhaiella tibetensis]QEE19418.1 DNA mismatch endonuclease Vsr [Youhaiella tibetensis]GGF33377.1 very short patch repair endonuclease [Youhaiella tibetensis]
MDTRSPAQRTAIMKAVKTKDTGPELLVRQILHREGYRFRLHRKDLPGRPDIVLPKFRLAIFVNGCFWHAHDCPKGRAPKSKLDYWGPKREANVIRDARAREALQALGWHVLVIWECEVKSKEFELTLLPSLRNSIDFPSDTR